MKVQILGTGCAKCRQLEMNAEKAIEKLGATCELVKVTDINDIISFGVMMTPGLAIDGKVMLAGRIATVEEIQQFITDAQ